MRKKCNYLGIMAAVMAMPHDVYSVPKPVPFKVGPGKKVKSGKIKRKKVGNHFVYYEAR